MEVGRLETHLKGGQILVAVIKRDLVKVVEAVEEEEKSTLFGAIEILDGTVDKFLQSHLVEVLMEMSFDV